MPTPVEVPKLGNTVEECIIARWEKRKGDTVAAGDLVAEIETDKATFEVTAPVGGTILETCFETGALAPVFATLFVLGDPGEAPEAPPPATPAAVETSAPALSPRARRFAETHKIPAPEGPGSGPNGRVLEQDLKANYRPPAPASSPVRETIARRLRESLATTAQYTLHSFADATAILARRAKLKAAGSPVNINDLLAQATVRALLLAPALNSDHRHVHLGFACDTPRGLLVPVVRDAHTLDLPVLAARMKDLAARAVQGSISPDDLSGATFTISNLGNLGITSFTPILNPPQVGILGIGAIELKHVRREGRIELIDSVALSLTCDHQVIDGAPGARFLQTLAAEIARPASQ